MRQPAKMENAHYKIQNMISYNSGFLFSNFLSIAND